MNGQLRHGSVHDLIVRHPRNRVISGLAGGIAASLGIPAAYVRAAFVALGAALGLGAILYAIGSSIAPEREPAARRAEPHQRLGITLAFAGALLLLRAVGVWVGDAVGWALVLVSFGIAVSWDYASAETRTGGSGRTIVGAALLVIGLIITFTSFDAINATGPIVIAVLLTTAGFALIFGPQLWRLGDQLKRERTERIRSDERADVAAHLHDSVLQTLALIQRTDDPKRMVTLARAQERELRDWLYSPTPRGESLAAALQATAARVENALDVPIEVVLVGDTAMTPGVSALVAAAGEAMTNAAKHSGAQRVSVYAEVGTDHVEVYIDDQGTGFDRTAVPADRRGISESIEARVARRGGSATVVSRPGEGTEVHLAMPLDGRP